MTHGKIRSRLQQALVLLVFLAPPGVGAEHQPGDADTVTLTARNTDVVEVFEMLARSHRQNVMLAKDVAGQVSVNLYDVDFDRAVHIIAEAAGFAVERRPGTYLVLKRDDVGKDAVGAMTTIRGFKVQYSDPGVVADILKEHLSRYGTLTTFPDRNMIVVEDLPEFVAQVEQLLKEVDVQPRQILIEARVLEITLTDGETFGFDWKAIFDVDNGTGTVGTQGFTVPTSPGLFFDLVSEHVEMFLDTLTTRGRVRTLSTPKLLALENQEAEVIIGDETGYRVTTTINQVTTESIEFLESGVILKVQPWVDESGRVAMRIHPEVSTATVDAEGIPSKTTTAVTTQLLAEDGQTIFIGGLIRSGATQSHRGVPVLGSIPVVGRLFSRKEDATLNTETVVMITPHIVDGEWWQTFAQQASEVDRVGRRLLSRAERIDAAMDRASRIEEAVGILPREATEEAEPMERLDYGR